MRSISKKREYVEIAECWLCGYHRPSCSMQIDILETFAQLSMGLQYHNPLILKVSISLIYIIMKTYWWIVNIQLAPYNFQMRDFSMLKCPFRLQIYQAGTVCVWKSYLGIFIPMQVVKVLIFVRHHVASPICVAQFNEGLMGPISGIFFRNWKY